MKEQKKKKQQQHTPTELERIISFIFIENPGNEHVGRSELKRNSKDKIRLQKQIISHECVCIYILQLQCRNVKIVVEIPVVETNRGGKFIDPFIVYVYCY